MTKIRNNIYLGSERGVNQKDLDANGITAILCVADNYQTAQDIKYKYRCVSFGLHDGECPNKMSFITGAADALRELLDNGETVLVHCIAGSNRSPTIVAIYLCNTEHRGWDDVWAELRRLRGEVNEHSDVMKYSQINT
jgi:hypothetical protein